MPIFIGINTEPLCNTVNMYRMWFSFKYTVLTLAFIYIMSTYKAYRRVLLLLFCFFLFGVWVHVDQLLSLCWGRPTHYLARLADQRAAGVVCLLPQSPPAPRLRTCQRLHECWWFRFSGLCNRHLSPCTSFVHPSFQEWHEKEASVAGNTTITLSPIQKFSVVFESLVFESWILCSYLLH